MSLFCTALGVVGLLGFVCLVVSLVLNHDAFGAMDENERSVP